MKEIDAELEKYKDFMNERKIKLPYYSRFHGKDTITKDEIMDATHAFVEAYKKDEKGKILKKEN